MEDDFDDLAYHCAHVDMLIAGGFFNEDDLETYLVDLAFDPDAAPHARAVRDHALAAMAAKRTAEAGWPAVTDWNRLDRAFSALEAGGILALHNAGTTIGDAQSDAWDLIGRDPPGTWRGYAFYHGQDVERALREGALVIGYGAVADDAAARRAVGETIAACLVAEGFLTRWNGDPDTRLEVPGIVWQKRTDWVRPARPSASSPAPAPLLPPRPEPGPRGTAARSGLWRRLFG